MGRISPLIQSRTGDLHIGSSFEIAVCGKRDEGFIGKGSISTATRESTISALLAAGTPPDKLCRSCFTATVQAAYARART